jgi:hypothetical protein
MYKVVARETILWIHDSVPNYAYNGLHLEDVGTHFVYNLCKFKVIDKIIFVSEYQRQNTLKHFDLCDVATEVIPNGIPDLGIDRSKYTRIKHRLMFNPDPSRGLSFALDCFQMIREHIPEAALVVFRKQEFNEEIINKIGKLKNVICFGKVSPEKMAEEYCKADIWFYPTNVHETFCICALEAQKYGALCACTNIGGMADTVDYRGIKFDSLDVNYVTDKMIKLMNNEELKAHLRDEGYEYANNMKWSNIFENHWNIQANHNITSVNIKDIRQEIIHNLNTSIVIKYVRFGDGEYYCIKGVRGAQCDGTRYSESLKQDLIKAFKKFRNRKDVYVGLWPVEDIFKYFNNLVPSISNNLAIFNTFSFGKNLEFLESKLEIFKAIRDTALEKIYVCPQYLVDGARELFKIQKFVVIEESNFYELEFEEILNKLLNIVSTENPLILFSAGMGGKVLISNILENERWSFLDIGSAWCYLCGNSKTRSNHYLTEDIEELRKSLQVKVNN